jgi:hypothetical protein
LAVGKTDADQSSRLTRDGSYWAFTTSLWRTCISAYGLDGHRSKIPCMDIVAILLGIFAFAVLLALIEGIDRI